VPEVTAIRARHYSLRKRIAADVTTPDVWSTARKLDSIRCAMFTGGVSFVQALSTPPTSVRAEIVRIRGIGRHWRNSWMLEKAPIYDYNRYCNFCII
jgi:hypothetical protein